ncbi:hypothetical protein [Yoonia litorea]|uniref:Uncharacterized protein n=1 Tax=Yoonia litorea TaxID=1123755 RepID=A0A1I6MG43_9RHOB|nr:hypothetical protein [Yoonia litorea]SFS14706.1 hypothetical protein SAMN05444714_1740 [Yoonia litorea]
MKSTKQKTFESNLTAGPLMSTSKRMPKLRYNIENMRLGRMELGSNRWFKKATSVISHLDYPAIADVPLYRGKPAFLRDGGVVTNAHIDGVAKNKSTLPRKGYPPRFGPRILRAAEMLAECPYEHLGYLTAVTSMGTSKEDAYELVEVESKRLNRYIRNRFPHAIWLLVPEVSEHMAGDVQHDLLLDREWRKGLKPNHLVYKVHFHGVLYVPGLNPQDQQLGFQRHRNGKMVKHFAGNNQVRVLPIDRERHQQDALGNILGIIGYGTKKHFSPPCKARMLEGYAEWIWLTHRITMNTNLVLTGGTTSGIHLHCSYCDHYFLKGDQCRCMPVFEDDDFCQFSTDGSSSSSSSDSHSGCSDIPLRDDTNLNSVGLDRCETNTKTVSVKNLIIGLVQGFTRLRQWMQGLIRGP